MQVAVSDVVDADLDRWDAWRPDQVARLLAGVRAPWAVAAGWSIDLFLGGQRREHEDLEIAVPGDRFAEIGEAFPDCDFFLPLGDGSERLRRLDPAGELLATHHQTWARERSTGKWRLDVFREPFAEGLWVCRRDEALRLPYEEVILRTADGIPFQRPEITLLFKAKHARPRDDADLAAVLPALEPERRAWLAEWLQRIHPGHRWLARIRAP
ncbi:MAG: hypothetical protein ICV64_00780 [Thermoleophilia bacterium]|nr:hypothetical protein [Thermoleophilia bacterium]